MAAFHKKASPVTESIRIMQHVARIMYRTSELCLKHSVCHLCMILSSGMSLLVTSSVTLQNQ